MDLNLSALNTLTKSENLILVLITSNMLTKFSSSLSDHWKKAPVILSELLPCGKAQVSAESRATCEWVHSVLLLWLLETPVFGTPVSDRGHLFYQNDLLKLHNSYKEFSAFKNLGTVS